MKPLLTICVFTMGLIASSGVNSSVFSLSPTQDAFVDSVLPDSNFGNEQVLVTLNQYPGRRDIYSYLMFDLSAIPASEAITGASLRLYQFDGAGFYVGTSLYHVSDDSWTESTLTWNTMPATSSRKPLGYNSNGPFYRGWSAWEPLVEGGHMGTIPIGEWKWGADLADGTLSLRLEQAVGGDSAHGWYSKEFTDATLSPLLVITTVPVPASFWLMGSVLAAFGIRRHRRVIQRSYRDIQA